MMLKIGLVLLGVMVSCWGQGEIRGEQGLINEEGATVGARILVPDGFERVGVEEDSFAHYLRTLPLKPHQAKVRYYDGTVKYRDVHMAVIDMDTGNRDLQQCADAIMRLRGEYFYRQKKFERIHFNLTNGFRVDYSKWTAGNRIRVTGNNTEWVKAAAPANTYSDFREYMDFIFTYAGTLSLSKELKSIDIEALNIGDIFIQGGSPGHAVIVVDAARHLKTGRKIFLLAQSYMPAQDIHILQNPTDHGLGPWYPDDFGESLITPEWTFKKTDLKRFKK